MADAEYNRNYYALNKERIKMRVRKWDRANPEKVAKRVKKWAVANREKMNAYRRKWLSENPDKRRLYKRKAYLLAKDNPSFRLRENLRRKVQLAIGRQYRTGSAITLLGCSIEDLWILLESKFETGMTRQNYGSVWHVDHIVPCALFDLSNPDHQKRCFHFSNLQPMFASDNCRKQHRIIEDHQFEVIYG